MRFFNTAGPINSDDHYCIPPLERLSLNEILTLVNQKKYFVLHAPRQTGKTTCLLALMAYLNANTGYRCVYCNVEAAQASGENVNDGIRTILAELASGALDHMNDGFIDDNWLQVLEKNGPFNALNRMLSLWSAEAPAPLVILLDEIDSLVGDTLISVLRQLRSGYAKRPQRFPQSIILCGVRDVRDYRIHSTREKTIITGGSAFNVKSKSLRLGDFDRTAIDTLYAQHTAETGQRFGPHVCKRVWHLTNGQPWLVNALGYEACFEIEEGRDRSRPITVQSIDRSKENLILRRDTHLDQLGDKLQEERVRKVIEPILAGFKDPEQIPIDDLYYARDLGLIRIDGQIHIANRIYEEIIPRELSYGTQVTISEEPAWYILPSGRLDMDKLLAAFQRFFREHSEHWVDRFQYKEAGPQLLLQAFLQRIVNSGGTVTREYGLGKMRTDLMIQWPLGDTTRNGCASNDPTAIQKAVIELKVVHQSLDSTIANGLEQTSAYMERCGTDDGHLVIFDRRNEKTWDEKIFHKTETYQEKKIQIWGM